MKTFQLNEGIKTDFTATTTITTAMNISKTITTRITVKSKCRKATFLETITILQDLFFRFGIPDTIVSDNRSQFTSADFKEFCKCQMTEHMSTSPYHPRSNGQVERFVETFKRALKKIKLYGNRRRDTAADFGCVLTTPYPKHY